ncbi:hypothetical protein DFH29DRAFT_984705 [Suillus ampliporus]|nr:hypothetical protein DFH29DRAFT_984705 [Suillus ampliporus]
MFKSQRGCTKHIRTHHSSIAVVDALSNGPANFKYNGPDFDLDHDGNDHTYSEDPIAQSEGPSESQYHRHPHLRGDPCDHKGNMLPSNAPIPARHVGLQGDWDPFGDQAEFLLANFLFRHEEMSAANIDFLMELWAFKAAKYEEDSPFKSHRDVYATIDAIRAGDIPWQCFSASPLSDGTSGSDVPRWKQAEYQVWYRDPEAVIQAMLANPDFDGQFDYTPYVHYDPSGKRRWKDFMTGNYAWHKSDTIFTNDPSTDSAMYVGVILGSDKTTVSIATGHVEYHPLYLSIGNPHNSVRRAHHNAVTLIGFLAIPKADHKYDNDVHFRTFKRQLYHSSIAAILQPLQAPMTTPIVQQCPDGHFQPWIVQNWSPRNDRTREYTEVLVETLTSDMLWDQYRIDDDVVPFTNDFPLGQYSRDDFPWTCCIKSSRVVLKTTSLLGPANISRRSTGKHSANEIIDDIDHQIAATPAFSGLRRFPHGRRFKQWTGDNSKALMKYVYIPAIVEYVPVQLIECFSSFLDFCYLVRWSELGEDTIDKIIAALQHFHETCKIFRESGVQPKGFALPRQHSLVHYVHLIQEYGAPNGLCSSITESRHITAVKKPWRRSNRYEALGQMLLTNQCLDKLAAARVEFVARGLLPPSHLPPPGRHSFNFVDGADEGAENDAPDMDLVEGSVILARTPQRGYPQSLETLAAHIRQPKLPLLARQFLFNQLHPNYEHDVPVHLITTDELPVIDTPIAVFHSAIATFSAPSDMSGTHGMHRKLICCTPSWHRKDPRYDCVFIVEDQEKAGMRGMIIGGVKLFFSFLFEGVTYPCVLIDRFSQMGRGPDSVTGMWKVKPEITGAHGARVQSVEHVDTILQSAHLIPIFGSSPLPDGFHFAHSLDVFNSYYVNKYADHHAHEIVF